jgi:hypothetical protein
MASVYGKTRGESGIVLDAISDSLVKLSVYAERVSSSASNQILDRVTSLVRRLLHGASGEQWLSLSSLLRELAEAAPEEFLSAVDDSLRCAEQPVTCLISESSNSASTGRCWHADLLWALELLAWSPVRLYRVADALARLSEVPLPGNWGNTPGKSLHSLFRPSWPQTVASSERRLAVLDRLIQTHNESAWSLMVSMLPRRQQWAIPNAAPVWREDDAGKADLLRTVDLGYLSEIGVRVIAQAARRPDRIASLIESLDSFEGEYRDSVLHLVQTATEFDDDGKTSIRDSLRKYLGWHNSYNQDGERKSRSAIDLLRPMFDHLAPADPIKAFAWLFESDWVTLPDVRERDFERHREALEQQRQHALNSVFASLGWPGISRLSSETANPMLVNPPNLSCYNL